MIDKKNFFVDKSIFDNTKWGIYTGVGVAEVIGQLPFKGAYSIIPARLIGLSYPDYCRMARDVYGAKLFGKTGRYIGLCFPSAEQAEKLCSEINKRWNLALEEGLFG